jgi:hypothetical protein
VERDKRRNARLSGPARRLSVAVLCIASTWSFAAATARADPSPPTNDGAPPTISGTAQEGEELTVDPGGWSGDDPITFSYTWSDGQTGSTITPLPGDLNHSLSVVVTASNDAGDTPAPSVSTSPVLPAAPTPTPGSPPEISGKAQQDETLSVSQGAWDDAPTDAPTRFSYAWEDCDGSLTVCTPISGATSSSYTLQASDVSSTIVAQVTAWNDGGNNTATSAATGLVLPAAPQVGTAPGISGTPQQGATLTVGTGVWSNNPTGYTYAWQDCATSTGTGCSAIPAATSNTYTVQASDVKQYLNVKVTASNAGGKASVFTTTVGPVTPPAPVNGQAPVITRAGGVLSVSTGTWSNFDPAGFSYAWETCNSSGTNCSAIPGATSSSYALSVADVGSTIRCVVTATGPGGNASKPSGPFGVVTVAQIPAASQPTTTGLLATPSAPVTNQSVTLIATVTAGTSSTALWGTVTFENGAAAIPGCASMPAVPSGRSATVACSTSFAASTAQLRAVFSPTSGSILKGSTSPGARLTVGRDSTSTTLTAASSVTVGSSTTFTATVGPPAARPGPVRPSGLVEFLDGSTPIGSCATQPLSGGAASCTVSYATAGTHQITARYAGDANFGASSSPAAQVNAVPVPTSVLGTITATMQWAFYFTPKYTVVRNLVVNGASPGAKVLIKCQGRGCPFANRATVLTKGKRCARKAKRSCITPGTLNLTSVFAGRHLRVGARLTISIIRSNWVGKSYSFTIRPRRGPRVQIGTLPVS